MKIPLALGASPSWAATIPNRAAIRSRFARIKQPAQIWLPLLMVAVSTGCGQNDIRVYRIAKEAPQPEELAAAQPGALPPGHPDIPGASPRLKWKLPACWEEVAPGEMRVASFRVKGQNGKQADVSIVPLGGLAGGELNNVNRWRGQVGQPPVAEGELAKLAQPAQIGGQPARLYEQAGKAPNSDDPTRILAAFQRRDDTSWFFKMTGDDQLVAEQKPAFIEFLGSVSFADTTAVKTDLPPSHPPINPAALQPPGPATAADPNTPKWQTPSGWKEVAAGQFLVAKFIATGSGNAQAAINVSMSAGDGGGLSANVNRWRGQLGLQPLAQAELEKQAKPLEVSSGKATLVEMTGTDARTGQASHLVGAIIAQGDRTWFYKLMGDEKVVQQQKDAFVKFVRTAKYP